MTQTSRLREWDDVNALLHSMRFQMQRPSTVLRGEVDGGWGWGWGWGGARGFSDAMQRLEALARAGMKQARQASKKGETRLE